MIHAKCSAKFEPEKLGCPSGCPDFCVYRLRNYQKAGSRCNDCARCRASNVTTKRSHERTLQPIPRGCLISGGNILSQSDGLNELNDFVLNDLNDLSVNG